MIHRLDKLYSDAAKTVQVADYDYDVDGFLTARTEGSDVTTYDYSSQGELLEVVLPDATDIEYHYDALGRRVAKEVNDVLMEKYLWAGMNQGLLAVYDGSDNLVVRYEYAGGRLPAAFTYASATYYPVYDQVGSLRAIFDSAGNKVYELTYDSFGNILSESGTFTGPVPHGFAGGLHDRDTGLVLFGHRDYDPQVGRWTAKDPIGFAGGLNVYSYVSSNPIAFADPTGLYEWGAFFGGFWESIADNSYAVSHPFAADAWERSSIGQAWSSRNHYPVESYGAMAGAGAATVAAAGAAGILFGGEAVGAGGSAAADWTDGPGYPINDFEYDPRVRNPRGLDDPTGHNFPYSFDRPIIEEGTREDCPGGYTKHRLPGNLNGHDGEYEIGRNRDGVINHRHFRRF